jgi:hypothetical protein
MGMIETIVPVIVGGMIGIAGTIAGPPLTHFLSQRAEQKRTRQAKLQELICLLYDHNTYAGQIMILRVTAQPEPSSAPPLPRALALVAVHLPELDEDLETLYTLYMEHDVETARLRVEWLAGNRDAPKEAGMNTYRSYVQRHVQIIRRIKKMVQA